MPRIEKLETISTCPTRQQNSGRCSRRIVTQILKDAGDFVSAVKFHCSYKQHKFPLVRVDAKKVLFEATQKVISEINRGEIMSMFFCPQAGIIDIIVILRFCNFLEQSILCASCTVQDAQGRILITKLRHSEMCYELLKKSNLQINWKKVYNSSFFVSVARLTKCFQKQVFHGRSTLILCR